MTLLLYPKKSKMANVLFVPTKNILALVLEFEFVDADYVAILNTHFFQPIKQAAFP